MKRWLIMAVTLMMPAATITSGADAHFYSGCKKNRCKRHVLKPFKPHVLSIAYCESRLRWGINSVFDGGLQFSPSTWNATGSKYNFAYQAPPLEQMYRGVIWAEKIGWNWHSTAGWPVCG